MPTKKKDYKTAYNNYLKATEQDSNNSIAQFNLGNSLQKQNESVKAEKVYDELAASASSTNLKSKAYYNEGFSLIQQKKIADAINAFKQSLRLLPEDDEARENLQKALNELKQQQQQNQPQQNQKKQQQQQNQSPPPSQPKQNKLTPQRAEQLLSNLREQEKQLQKQLQKQKLPNDQQEKDW